MFLYFLYVVAQGLFPLAEQLRLLQQADQQAAGQAKKAKKEKKSGSSSAALGSKLTDEEMDGVLHALESYHDENGGSLSEDELINAILALKTYHSQQATDGAYFDAATGGVQAQQ